MTDELKNLQRLISESVDLIDERLDGASSDNIFELIDGTSLQSAADASSLLEHCSAISSEYQSGGKPLLRVVHHLACSGGTLMSKCIAAMPNVFVLSEVHPNSKIYPPKGRPHYMPADISTLAKYARVPDHPELASEIFRKSVDTAHEHLSVRGGILVLRDHTHSDFCVGSLPSERPAIYDLLEDSYEFLSVVTIRDPVDCYISLKKNKWLHFDPPSFEEYCKRYKHFLDSYPDSPMFRYEDFVSQPQPTMKELSESLRIPYSEMFEYVFEASRMTGDSGRSSGIIAPRSRTSIDHHLMSEIKQSDTYIEICERCSYSFQS